MQTVTQIRQIVLDHKEDFTRLYVNYSSLRGGLSIKMANKVFYSDTEREYYERDLIADLKRNYHDLYNKYISSKHPELRRYYRLILPRFLEELLDIY